MGTTNTETIADRGSIAFSEFAFQRFSAECAELLRELKERIAANLADEFAGALDARLVRQVVNEADSLAATTPFPALLLPELAEEKVRNVSAWAARQQAIREQALATAA